MFEKCVIINNFRSRKHYLPDLVRRLKNVPQLFPPMYNEYIRNRFDHVNNMYSVVSSLFANKSIRSEFEKEIKSAIILHDIGHSLFGHAGERALSDSLLNYGGFSNSAHTERLLFSYIPMEIGIGLKTIFDTEPLNQWASFHQKKSDKISLFVDFIDDLENTIGDLRDIILTINWSKAKKLFKYLLSNTSYSESVHSLCLDFFKKINLNNDILLNVHEINTKHFCWDDLKKIRNEISEVYKFNEIIRLYDEKGYWLMKNSFELIYENLNNNYKLDEATSSLYSANLAASLYSIPECI